MALQSIKSGLYLPDILPYNYSILAGTLIDAAGEKAASIIRIPKTGTISKILFRTGAVTTSETLKISLQTVSSGVPSGSNYGGSAPGTQAAPGANTVYAVSLGTSATVTKGDLVAVVVEFDSAIGDLEIAKVAGVGAFAHDVSFPYGAHFTASWAKDEVMIVALEYSGGGYESIPGVFPFDSFTSVSFNSGSTPDERALRFNLPFPCRVAGFWAVMDIDNAVDIVLYQGVSALQSKSYTSDQRQLTNPRTIYLDLFDSPEEIVANTEYFLSLKPTTGSSIGLNYFTVNAAAIMDCFSGGQQMHLGTRVDAGAWSMTTTTRPLMGLIFDQIDDGVGAGGAPNLFAGLFGKA